MWAYIEHTCFNGSKVRFCSDIKLKFVYFVWNLFPYKRYNRGANASSLGWGKKRENQNISKILGRESNAINCGDLVFVNALVQHFKVKKLSATIWKEYKFQLAKVSVFPTKNSLKIWWTNGIASVDQKHSLVDIGDKASLFTS